MTEYHARTLLSLYRAILHYWSVNQYSPSIGDLARELGVVSRSNLVVYLRQLERMDLIKMTPGKARSIILVGSKWTPPRKIVKSIIYEESRAYDVQSQSTK